MSAFLDSFHFLRPTWFLAVIPLLALIWLLRRRGASDRGWDRVIAPELLRHLLPQQLLGKRWPVWGFSSLWLLTVLALAGPTWQQIPQPVQARQNHLVVLMDLSLSTLATDLQPNRLTRAKQKLTDLLSQRHEGYTALIAYAGDSHVVSPLTDDSATIQSMVPALDPFIMPALGSRPERAVKQALDLLKNAGASQGQILLLTDDVTDAQAQQIRSLLKGSDYHLSIISVGTPNGGPIAIPNQGFLEEDGHTVIAKVDEGVLRQLAQAAGGNFAAISLDDQDLHKTLGKIDHDGDYKEVDHALNVDLWQDAGYWLVFPLIPLSLWLYRRGAILALFLAVGLLPRPSHAFDWQDLWKTPDQQGQQAYQAKDYEGAANSFQNPDWKGTALYRAEKYEEAAQTFQGQNSAQSFYNQGNALTHAKKYPQAIAAYEQALKLQPDFADAQHNKQLVEDFLKQQQEQKNQQGQNQQNQQNQGQQGQNQQNQQSQGQQGQNQQNPQNQGQQDQNQQNPQNQGQQDQNQQNPQSQGQQDQNQQAQDEGLEPQQSPSKPGEKQQPSPQSMQAQADGEKSDADKSQPQGKALSDDDFSDEQKQAFEQWLRRVPDDPGGLLRRKFEYQYRDRGDMDRTPSDQPIW